MSQTVDNRIVEMQFNNKQFESNVGQSVESLDKLKKSLELTGAEKGMNNISAASKKFSLSGISEGVDTLSSRFSAMGIVGMTVLQNLTNAAINYGKKILNNMITPLKQGFSEYETQMNAIQTVLANTESKGTTLEDVTAALDELNTYADKTIYNFTEMTKNIGTFTAAGVDLETSTAAIKGIANLAAVSGSNSQQAATAMYQLSQALSSGTVKLMDWNSVVNAGMGGQVFQDALKETARVSGIAIDQLIDQHGSFRETLSTGWLSSEVLLDTLAKFTGDLTDQQLLAMGYTEDQIAGILKLGETANDAATKVKTFTQLKDTLAEAIGSGWTKTFQLILGDFEEARDFFTRISDILNELVGASSDARNNLLQDWNTLGGRADLVQAVFNIFEAGIRIMNIAKAAFKDVFPEEFTSFDLWRITNALKAFTENLLINGRQAKKIRSIFQGLFSIFKIVLDVVKGLIKPFIALGKGIDTSSVDLLGFLARIGDAITEFANMYDIVNTVATAIGAVGVVLYNLGTWIVHFAKLAWKELEPVREIFYNLGTWIAYFARLVVTEFDTLIEKVKEFFSTFTVDTSGIKNFFGGIKESLSGIGDLLGKTDKAKEGITDVGKSASLIPDEVKAGLEGAGDWLKTFGDTIAKGLGSINLTDIFDSVFKGLTAALAGSLFLAMKRFVDSGGKIIKEGANFLEGITGILDGVKDSLKAYQAQLKSKVLINIAIAIGILAASLLVMSLIDSDKLVGTLAAVTTLFANLIASMAAFNKIGGTGGVGASASIIGLSVAILILGAALKKISDIDAESLWRGIQAIYAMMAGVLIFSKLMSKNMKAVFEGSGALAIFAGSLYVLVQSVGLLGNMKMDVLRQGLISLGVLMAEVGIFMRLAGDSKLSAKAGAGLLIITGAIYILAHVVEKFGNMDVEAMKQGLVAIGAVLLQIGLFTRLVGEGKGIIQAAVSMTIMSGALWILVHVIERMGDLSWEQLGRGLAGMAASLLILAIAMRAMPKNMASTGVSLLIVSGALVVLAEALTMLGDLSWEQLGKGLLTMGVALGILAVALNTMTGAIAGSAALLIATAALYALTGVLTILGQMPLIAIVTALGAIAATFGLLALAGYLLTPVVPTLLGVGTALLMLGGAVALVGGGLALMAIGLTAFAASGAAAALAITAFVGAILGIIPQIIKTLIDAIILFAEGVVKATPVVGQAILGLINTFLDIIIKAAPKLFEALNVLLTGLIKLIRDKIPDFVEAVILLLLTLLQTIAGRIPEFVQAGFDILIGFLEGIRDNIGDVVTVAIDIVTEFIDAVAEKIPDVIQSGFNLILEFINGLADAVDNNLQPILDAIGRLASSIIEGLVTGLFSGVGQIATTLINVMSNGFEALKNWLFSNSPSKRFIPLGESIPQGLAVGVTNLGGLVGDAVTDVGEQAVSSASGISEAIANAFNSEIDIDPTIRPVVDITEIEAAGSLLDDIMSSQQLNLTPAMIRTSSLANSLGISSEINPGGKNGETKIEFTQNNYSPKALSRIELYRQTNNQLRMLKGVIG